LQKKLESIALLVGLACYLHDCCKEVKDKELIERALAGGLELSAIDRVNGHLLHGPVAALTIKQELKISNKEVLAAISEHTLGNVPMSEVSKVVFLADCLRGKPPQRLYGTNLARSLQRCPY
jgi:HD superfamily phosphohydrolase YqeK